MTPAGLGTIMGETLHVRATLPMRTGMTETYTVATPTGATAMLLARSPIGRRYRGSLRAALVASSVGADDGPQRLVGPRIFEFDRSRWAIAPHG
jgi:hypothetical protein